MLTFDDFRALLAQERLPAAVVDLDALSRNVARVRLLAGGARVRVASKSVRHVGLLRRILEQGGPTFQGILCYSAEEADFLASEGFDDLLVAYPTVQPAALGALAGAAARGATLAQVVDCPAHLDALDVAGRAAGVRLRAVIEVDVALRRLGQHIGARRSPVRTAADALALARHARGLAGVEIIGIMAYEAHIAGLQDHNPFTPWMDPARWLIKKLGWPEVRRVRQSAVEALRGEGVALQIVNGGGTGDLLLTPAEPDLTEITVGSGFLCSHLFDYYAGLGLEPAAFFALELSRVSDPGFITCNGGGYVASGEPGWDRLPIPWLPRGLRYLGAEGAGEVQTPLRLPADAPALRLGDPIVFRHAKAGELCERFNALLLAQNGAIVAREPTYRGQGRCFG